MKLSLSNLASGFRSSNKLNENFQAIRDAFDNTLSRDGSTPNQMTAPLDMNSQRVINVGTPVNNTDAVRLSDITDGGLLVPPVDVSTFMKPVLTATTSTGATAAMGAARASFAVQAESSPRSVESRFSEEIVLSTAWGADPSGIGNSQAALQAAIDSSATRSVKIIIPPGNYAFNGSVNVPQGKRIGIYSTPDTRFLQYADLPILNYTRTASQDDTILYVDGGFWINAAVTPQLGAAIRFWGRSITEHNNRLFVTNIECRRFNHAFETRYTGGRIDQYKGLENAVDFWGEQDTSFFTWSDCFSQNPTIGGWRLDGTGEALGVSNGVTWRDCVVVGSASYDYSVRRYDAVEMFSPSGDLGGSTGLASDGSIQLYEVTHVNIRDPYLTSRGTSFDYTSPRINRAGIYADTFHDLQISGGQILYNRRNVRLISGSPGNVNYFGPAKISGVTFKGTSSVTDKTEQHIIALGVRSGIITGCHFDNVPDRTGFNRQVYLDVIGNRDWTVKNNQFEGASYNINFDNGSGGTETVPTTDNRWGCKVAQG